MFKQLFKSFTEQRHRQHFVEAYRKLIHREAFMGGHLFGKLPPTVRREFFCLDEHTWVWHEEWTDQNSQRHIMTTRYDVRPTGILKSQNNSHYQRVTPEETSRLLQAARLYLDKARREIYHSA